MRDSYYVGLIDGKREVYRSKAHAPESRYTAVIGPFKTRGGAEVMARYGRGNPHLQHVNDAERMSKQLGARWYTKQNISPTF